MLLVQVGTVQLVVFTTLATALHALTANDKRAMPKSTRLEDRWTGLKGRRTAYKVRHQLLEQDRRPLDRADFAQADSTRQEPCFDRDLGKCSRDSYLQETAGLTAEGSASQTR
eukprot:188483-Amphidinium_carterae.1